MKAEIEKCIAAAAKMAAEEVVRQQCIGTRSNHYKDTERLLRNYKAMKRLYERLFARSGCALDFQSSKLRAALKRKRSTI